MIDTDVTFAFNKPKLCYRKSTHVYAEKGEDLTWHDKFKHENATVKCVLLGSTMSLFICHGEDEVFRRRFNLEGDVTWCHARVTGKEKLGNACLVHCDLRCVDQRGEENAKGQATVALPSKSGWLPAHSFGGRARRS